MSKSARGLALLLALSAGQILWAPAAQATLELDRQYALENVGYLRSYDNVDGLFSEYVNTAYKEYFSKQSRFILHDLTKADEVLTKTKLPYPKVIMDKEILGQLSRSTRTQMIVRTQIIKEGKQYRFTLDLLHAPKMDTLASESFVMADSSDTPAGAKPETLAFGPENLKNSLQQALDRLVAKLPFMATVTGRDNSSVTVNVGANAKLKPGDTLVIATLDDVKKHPLLNEIVQWRLTPTGKAEVTEVEDAIAFAKITDEEEDRHVGRYQKVTRIIPKPVNDQEGVKKDDATTNPDEPPRIGWISGALPMGGYSRQYTSLIDTTAGRQGGALTFGVKADGQVWLTKEYFFDFGLGYQFGSYSQNFISNGQSTNVSASMSVTQTKLDVGYSYLVTGDFFGPKGWLKLGYHGTSYSLPSNISELTAPISFKALFLGVGGELPIRDQWGALLNLEFGLFSSADETGKPSGSVNSATDVAFFFGGYYRWTNRMTLRAGLDIMGQNAEFSTNNSLNQKVITFSPALLYYF